MQQQLPFLKHVYSRDPYSLQLSFIFPRDWDARLPRPDLAGMTGQEKLRAEEAYEAKKTRFRQFVEQTVREETPAHLTPYIHWLTSRSPDGIRKILPIMGRKKTPILDHLNVYKENA